MTPMKSSDVVRSIRTGSRFEPIPKSGRSWAPCGAFPGPERRQSPEQSFERYESGRSGMLRTLRWDRSMNPRRFGPLGKRVNIPFFGPEKIEKVDAPVFAGLRQAQERQVLVNAFPRRRYGDHVAQPREGLDSVLGVVVVPGNAAVIREREKRATVLQKPLFACRVGLTGELRCVEKSEERVNVGQVLSEETRLQPTTVDGLHDPLQQIRERQGDGLHLLVERVVQNRVVEISHEVHQAFLLRARNGLVGRVEVGHQDAPEILQQLPDDLGLAAFGDDRSRTMVRATRLRASQSSAL